MAYRLLLADDSITIQKVVELTLSEEDFVVTAVGDGAAGLEAAKKLVPDIILADVFMPKMDGYELCGRLKQDPALRHIPVILLAGTFENFDDAKAAKAGADDHLTKPFESAELISMAKKLVERAKTPPAPVLEAEPVLEAMPFEEAAETNAPDSDDLWSVVSMASDEQPLAKATDTLTENDLWKRANLLSETEETASFPQEEEAVPWGGLTAEPIAEAEEVLEDAGMVEETAIFEDLDTLPEMALEAEPDIEATAILNMDDLKPAYGWDKEEPPAIELADFAESAEVTPSPVISMEAVRAEVQKAVREALTGISREMIEQIVWEVVPDLAEEILVKEIEKLKTGIG